jgi:hypothetical protein
MRQNIQMPVDTIPICCILRLPILPSFIVRKSRILAIPRILCWNRRFFSPGKNVFEPERQRLKKFSRTIFFGRKTKSKNIFARKKHVFCTLQFLRTFRFTKFNFLRLTTKDICPKGHVFRYWMYIRFLIFRYLSRFFTLSLRSLPREHASTNDGPLHVTVFIRTFADGFCRFAFHFHFSIFP